MARRCQITGKRNNAANHVSHAKNHVKRVQKANIKKKRLFVPELGRFVRVKVSTQALRTLNKKSLVDLLKDNGLTLKDIA
jgi:large subunit ribosomal protein L28